MVIEADAKDASIDRTLTDLYYAKHFYAEAQHEGRLYVFGNPKTQESFAQTGSLTFSRSLIGEGPGGATLVVEVDPKSAELETRLLAEVARRHGLDLSR